MIAALGHQQIPYELIGQSADLGFVTPHTTARATETIATIRAAQESAGRAAETVHIFADLVVFLDDSTQAAADRKARLDELAGSEYQSDALILPFRPIVHTHYPEAFSKTLLVLKDPALKPFGYICDFGQPNILKLTFVSGRDYCRKWQSDRQTRSFTRLRGSIMRTACGRTRSRSSLTFRARPSPCICARRARPAS